MLYTFKELFQKLKREHNDNYYYRGQNQLFPGPLWPSMYRGARIIDTMELPSNLQCRYNRGKQFGFRSNYLVAEKYNDPKNLKLRELKRCMMGYIRNALGYCLSEAMFQQAGWDSEGLDVTSNIDIAMFFATHSFSNNIYEPDNSDKERIIYRWKIPTEEWSFEKLNETNFYNCPFLLPSEQILDLFEECDSIFEFEESILEYRNTIGWEVGFDYRDMQGKRPYHIIRIPRDWKKRSRIAQQSASLIFPDSISYDEFKKHYSFKDKECQEMAANGGIFIEDLSKTYDCEIFKFKTSPDDLEHLCINKEQIYIEKDISHAFLDGWIKSYHQNPNGIISILMVKDNNYLSKIDMDLNFDLLRYETYMTATARQRE